MTDARDPTPTPSVSELARSARQASKRLARLDGASRSALLRDLATRLRDPEHRAAVLRANTHDMDAARAAQARGELPAALVARLELSEGKLDGLCTGLEQLADMPELVGARQLHRKLDEGLILERCSAPLGVLGVVFEARPDAVVQIAGLALKSGNAVLLKGGSEALASNRALTAVVREALGAAGLPEPAVTLLEDRAQFGALLDCAKEVDLIIARGSSAFVRMVMEKTAIPVMGHAEGLCHLYLHADADPQMAASLAVDAKCSYPAACNAIETLLWHADAGEALDEVVAALEKAGVELRGCPDTRARHPDLALASEADWSTEYTDLVLSIMRVPDLETAMAHIGRYGSQHTEAIVTADKAAAERFMEDVDAAGVFWNASTRFADGFRYGLGAEVGVSTQKLHARGPVGVEGLLTYRYLLRGEGHRTTDYGPGKRPFRHEELD